MPQFNGRSGVQGRDLAVGNFTVPSGGGSALYTWYAPLSTPTQPDIERDGTEYYWPLDDSTPDTSVSNYAGAKTLSSTGGTMTRITTVPNTQGVGVNFNQVGSLAGAAGTLDGNLGTQDMYLEFYARFLDSGGAVWMIVGAAADFWSMYMSSQALYFQIRETWVTQQIYTRIDAFTYVAHGTWHHYLLKIDRDTAANRGMWIDGVKCSIAADSLTAGSAYNVLGTNIEIGSVNEMEISQLKIVYGAYDSSTTPAFDKGLTVDTGTSALTFARTTEQTGKNINYNPDSDENHVVSMIANPVIHQPDVTETAAGVLVEDGATNQCEFGRQLGNAQWVKSNITATDADGTTPEGVIERATKLVSTAINATCIEDTGAAVVASREHCFSFWIKGNAGGETVRLQCGSVGETNTAALLDAETGAAGTITTDWKRFYVKHTMQAGAAGTLELGILMDVDAETIWVDMGQCESTYARPASSPSSYIHALGTQITRTDASLSIPNTELGSTEWSWLAMFSPMFNSSEIKSTLYMSGVNADTGSTWLYVDSSLNVFNRHFGTANDTGTNASFSKGDWLCCGQVIDTVNDNYHVVWDGTLLAAQTDAKGTPTYSSAFFVGSDNSGLYPCDMVTAEIRIYKDIVLDAAQVASEYADMKTKMGLP